MRLMLHACCGPCSLEPTRIFTEEGVEFALDYCNSNIFPPEEYQHRLQTLADYVAEPLDATLIEEPYDPQEWEEKVAPFGLDREKRCRACYRLRLEKAAARAAAEGYDALATTLTISPYQYTDIIFEELERAASAQGIKAVCRDFRACYPEATRRSRELGMYRQNYCGCRFSIAEAKAERDQRKAELEAEKAAKHRAMIWAAASGVVSQANQM